MPVISALWRLRQDNQEFKARSCLKNKLKKKKKTGISGSHL
jgi:hypothetical protein